jgi:hypothetical protein
MRHLRMEPHAVKACAPRLVALIPRLASQYDGEVIATVRAIRQTLSGAGLDLHDLVDALVRCLPAPPALMRADDGPTAEENWRAAVRDLRRRWHFVLSDWERKCVASLLTFRTLPPKQPACLAGILERVRRETSHA